MASERVDNPNRITSTTQLMCNNKVTPHCGRTNEQVNPLYPLLEIVPVEHGSPWSLIHDMKPHESLEKLPRIEIKNLNH